MKIIDRIEKAISAVHGNRIVMHVPPFDSDVDVVLSDCRTLIEEQQKRIDKALKVLLDSSPTMISKKAIKILKGSDE